VNGASTLRPENERYLTGGGQYVGDLQAPDALHVAFVRSSVPHGQLLDVHTGDAAAVPGVVQILTAADLDLAPLAPYPPLLNQSMSQPLLAVDRVRYVGEPIAVVLASGAREATRAARLVSVDLLPLPALVDAELSVADEQLLHPDADTNTALSLTFSRPVRGDLFADCEVLLEQTLVNQRVVAAAMEPCTVLAVPDGALVTLWAGSQAPAVWRERLAAGLGLSEDDVRVIAPDVGGSFGSKALPSVQDYLITWLARRIGRPLRWRETRDENLVAFGHGRAQRQRLRIGGSMDGRIEAYQLEVLQDCGAYPQMGALLPFWTRTMLTGPYDIRRARFTSSSVVTTTAPVVAYRGAGQPEGVWALERAVDLFAAQIGRDPAEVRRMNLIKPEAMPYVTVTRSTYDSGNPLATLEAVLDRAGYQALRQEQDRRRQANINPLLGIGICSFIEVTGADTRAESAQMTLHRDGRLTIAVGTASQGQGHETTWRKMAADRLGLEPNRIDVAWADSTAVPDGGGTGGSRSVQTAGLAVDGAARYLVSSARSVLAHTLSVQDDQIRHCPHDGILAPAMTNGQEPQCWDWAGVAAVVPDVRNGADLDLPSSCDAEASVDCEVVDGELVVRYRFTPTAGTYPYGTHLAVVEVDTDTGLVALTRYFAVDDSGTLINPPLADAQVRGGVTQGVAQALYEGFQYSPEGQALTVTLEDYGVPSAADVPDWDVMFLPTATAVNRLGVRGVGETGALAAPPAVVNATVDALAHLGVRHLDMPLTPERVWRAIADAQ
jgi:carbon-monoxide dehydrogenase large subunit